MTDARHEAYRLFVESAARGADEDGYLFDAPRCRFVPEPSDELVAPPGAVVVRTPEGAAVELVGGARLAFRDLDFEELRAVFGRLPCRYSRLPIELRSKTASFVEQAFSRVLFAPAAVAALEARLPAVEIVRFPGSPYEVVRSYWRNLGAVRERLDQREPLASPEQLRTLLLELHALLLLGQSDADTRSSF